VEALTALVEKEKAEAMESRKDTPVQGMDGKEREWWMNSQVLLLYLSVVVVVVFFFLIELSICFVFVCYYFSFSFLPRLLTR
jgi:hypothetical protein